MTQNRHSCVVALTVFLELFHVGVLRFYFEVCIPKEGVNVNVTNGIGLVSLLYEKLFRICLILFIEPLRAFDFDILQTEESFPFPVLNESVLLKELVDFFLALKPAENVPDFILYLEIDYFEKALQVETRFEEPKVFNYIFEVGNTSQVWIEVKLIEI